MGKLQKVELQKCSGVPFLALGEVHLEAIETGEVPHRFGKGTRTSW